MLLQMSQLESEEDTKTLLEESFNLMQNLSSLQVEIIKWRLRITIDERFWSKSIIRKMNQKIWSNLIAGPSTRMDVVGENRKAIISGLSKYHGYVLEKVSCVDFLK